MKPPGHRGALPTGRSEFPRGRSEQPRGRNALLEGRSALLGGRGTLPGGRSRADLLTSMTSRSAVDRRTAHLKWTLPGSEFTLQLISTGLPGRK